MAVESTTSALNAHQASYNSLSTKVGSHLRERDDAKPKYEDPITKNLKKEESSTLTDGSEVALLGASSNSGTEGAKASVAAGAYETTASEPRGSIISDGEPPYARAAREIREYQEERNEKSREDRSDKEERALKILDERQRSGEITV